VNGQEWYRHVVAALNERLCPEHLISLRDSGWCPACGHEGAWWNYDRDSQKVTTTYAVPELWVFPEP
jgi:hypothetical protein